MQKTVGDHLLDRLSQWKIERIFGYPGDGINGIMGAMGRAAERFDYIRVRHEEMAAFMACAHAKFTGQTGVCLATSGPGAIHLLAGMYDARSDHQPMVAIVGQQAASSLGSDYQQEVDLQHLFQDVSAYVETVMTPSQLPHVIDRALRIAASERAVCTVIIPNDVQQMPAILEPVHKHGHVASSVGTPLPRPWPADAELAKAAEILNAGRKVAILVGAGALGATVPVMAIAQALSAGVAKALLGKMAVPDDLPYVTGAIGLLGTRASDDMMKQCDTLLMIGTTFPYSEFLPKVGQARAVQIDLQARNIGIRYPVESALIGDATDTLQRLLPLLKRKSHGAWRRRIEASVQRSREELRAQAMTSAKPINPQRVFLELSHQLPADVILCGDSGSHTNWYARHIDAGPGMLGSLSGKLASMGSGVPYAIAAKMAYPERPVIAMVGDGAMQMNGNAELVTVQQYCERWSLPTFIVLVVNNRDLNQVTWEQRALAGDPAFNAAQEVIDFPYARYAELLGFKGIRVDDPEQLADAWREALAADRPVVLECICDPDVPPLPPHIDFDQARKLTQALLGRDPRAAGVIRESLKQMMARKR
ncbi:thiamine pyrophosphate-requiring protein [Pseudomonas capeferrum]|uniref:thiamine pyrophosphate-requiring protein n=1 Tax=Pseudomonas capeferrum TaxID=1495066 RepID=UPI0015E2B1CA|nr:thiamine pyrophosphate-requiring protein [Pseudomonas capeferrum]MBA1204113.1 thiamine pyrophosphate-requiring protein [Pseudomonas capeferrum]